MKSFVGQFILPLLLWLLGLLLVTLWPAQSAWQLFSLRFPRFGSNLLPWFRLSQLNYYTPLPLSFRLIFLPLRRAGSIRRRPSPLLPVFSSYSVYNQFHSKY